MEAQDWRDAVLDALRLACVRWPTSPSASCCLGGLDSSLITALLAEGGQQHLQTFSIGFESHGDIEVTSSATRI